MLYVLVLASITLLLGFFQFYSAIRNRGSVFWSLFLVIIPLAVVIFSAKSVMKDLHTNNSSANSTSIASKSSSLKDDKLELIKSESASSSSEAQRAKDMQTSLTKSFKSFGTVSYDADTKTYSVSTTDEDTKKVFNQLIDDPSQMKNSNFNEIQDKFVEVSKTIKKEVGKGYSMQLNQPDKETPMIIAKDGKLSYSIFS